MDAQAGLREKLKKIEALVQGAATDAERDAAAAAIARVRAKLEPEPEGEPEDLQFQIAEDWSRHLFVALCRRNGLDPYRHTREDRATLTVRGTRAFVEGVVWRQFASVEAELRAYLTESALKIIREEIHADAREIAEALPAPTPEPEPELLLEPAEEPAPPKRWFAFGKLIRFNRRLARTATRTKH
ncbi:MAG: hypothetical protein ACKVRO_17255 [Micropepsaceae bacterium]